MSIKMNFFAVTALFCAGLSVSTFAQAPIEPQSAYKVPLASKALLTDIISVDGAKLVAVGERGHILYSTDGSNWQQADVPVQSNLNSVFFLNKQQGWAVGHDATILATSDGGASWELQQFLPETDKPLFDIHFQNPQHGIAVGAYGMFYRTQTGGKQWQREFHPELLSEDEQDYLAELKESDIEAYEIELGAILPHFNRIIADGNILYMVGEMGLAAKSNDYGQSWQRLPPFYNGSLFDLIRTPQLKLLAVGLRGNAFISADNGNTWREVEHNESATFNSAFTDDQQRIFLVGNAGALLISNDDGDTFFNANQEDGKAIVNGLVWDDRLILVTEAGIKTINVSELK